jgi:hypothetical protein
MLKQKKITLGSWQASGYTRARDRRPGTVSRISDPVGSGFYLFCGVRWLDPDAPADARLIADGLARLEADFPHLRGATTLHLLHVVIRQKRSTWEQHLRSRMNAPSEETYRGRVDCPVDGGIYRDMDNPEASCQSKCRPAAMHGTRKLRQRGAAIDCRQAAAGAGTSTLQTPRSAGPPAAAVEAGPPMLLQGLHPYSSGDPLPAALDAGPVMMPALPHVSLVDAPARPDSPWAWYPLALPPTPPAPAAGVAPPTDWPSPLRAEPVDPAAGGPGGFPGTWGA